MIAILWNDLAPAPFEALPRRFQVISSSEKWEELPKDDVELLVVLAELCWDKQKFSNFYGFTIVRNYRLVDKGLAPVMVCSFFPQRWFIEQESFPEYRVLITPGHYFARLPYDFRDLKVPDYQGLDDKTLLDINDHILGFQGIVDEEFHHLKNSFFILASDQSPAEVKEKRMVQEMQQSLTKIGRILQVSESELFLNVKDQIIQSIQKHFKEEKPHFLITKIVDNLSGLMHQFLPESIADKSLPNTKLPWKVLYVEDQQAIAKQVQGQLLEDGIECILASDATQAFDELKKDHDNIITVFICDYRLLKKGYWQALQGYRILEEVFLKSPNILAFFALTSFNRRALLKISEQHQMQVWAFNKVDVLSTTSGFQLFIEKVKEQGKQFFDVVCSQPRSSVWNTGYDKKFDRPLKHYYRLHRLASDYSSANLEIGQAATHYIMEISKIKQDAGYEANIPEYSFQEGIGKEKRPITEEEKLEKFRIKLIGRRIAIGLYHLLELSKGRTYWAMKTGIIGRDDESNTINQFFTTYLGISLEKDIPDYLLSEERHWLNYLMEGLKIK